MGSAARLLIVDDNSIDRELIRRLLGADYETLEASTASQGLDVSQQSDVDCVLLDYRLPDVDGIHALDRFVKRGLPVVMLTGQGDELVAVEAMKRGAEDYLVKIGLEPGALKRAVNSALEKRALLRRIEVQAAELEERVRELARQRVELESINRVLGEREAKLRVLLEQLPILAWTADADLCCISMVASKELVADAGDALQGRPVGAWLEDAHAREVLDAAHRRALDGRPWDFDLRMNGRDHRGHVEPLRDEEGRTTGVIGVSMDVTETRRLEQQLLQAQKMDAIGKLAGGVAHDFNNVLTAIVSFSGFVREELPEGEQAREDIDEVLRAADRAASLVRQLLAFSRQGSVDPQVVDPATVIAELVPMLRRLLGEDIRLIFEPDGLQWRTRIDPSGLEQILMNLAVNARDAMPGGGALVITIRTMSSTEVTRPGRRADLSPGDYIVLSVTDEGAGIPPELQDQIFEPFFTTKDVGKGTGLGLATCYGIARQAGGTLSVYSELGHGTTFRAYLPRSRERLSQKPATPTEPSLGGSETVLVVEDDRLVRSLVVRTLEDAGYTVLAADSGDAARALLEAHPAPIDLVICDVIMPGLSGPELIADVLEGRPEVRVLYMSGYAPAAVRQRGLVDAHTPMLEKPFDSDTLRRRVRGMLDARPAPGRADK